MFEIKLYEEYSSTPFFTYKSNILPQAGDVYAGITFGDGKQRTVIERLLCTDEFSPNTIMIRTKPSFK